MKILATALILVTTTAFAQATPDKVSLAAVKLTAPIPSVLIGTWKVGRAYDGGPTDLNEKQSLQIERLQFELTLDTLKVCGHNIAIKNVAVSVLTKDQFLTRYRILPNQIGLSGEKITELKINPYELTHSCGTFSDPGTDVILDQHNHFAIEVDNLYYPLKRAK